MSKFSRQFPFDKLTDETLSNAPWFRDLLSLWRPAGEAKLVGEAVQDTRSQIRQNKQENHLRLAMREDYLNFYRAGQSIARVSFGEGGLAAKIHNKYVYGGEGGGQRYVTLSGSLLIDKAQDVTREYGGLADLGAWVSNAEEYTGEEKTFVDQVVGSNPDIIDLEMGLPARTDAEDKTAPRMDLVTLEPAGERWRVVFWEAKLTHDSRVRRRDDSLPHVVGQLDKYADWLSHEAHAKQLAKAYQNTCRLLVSFWGLAQSINREISPLGPGIIAVATEGAPEPEVDPRPRLIFRETGESPVEQASFVVNGHLDKLRRHGLRVQLVGKEDDLSLRAAS